MYFQQNLKVKFIVHYIHVYMLLYNSMFTHSHIICKCMSLLLRTVIDNKFTEIKVYINV